MGLERPRSGPASGRADGCAGDSVDRRTVAAAGRRRLWATRCQRCPDWARRTGQAHDRVTVSWSRSVGLSSEPHGPLPAILLALTFVTGLVDAASFLLLGHVFVANMTGNILFIGFALVGVGGVSLPSVVLATAFFGVGAMTGGRIIARIRHRGRALFIAAIVEAVLLGAAAVVAVGARGPNGSP